MQRTAPGSSVCREAGHRSLRPSGHRHLASPQHRCRHTALQASFLDTIGSLFSPSKQQQKRPQRPALVEDVLQAIREEKPDKAAIVQLVKDLQAQQEGDVTTDAKLLSATWRLLWTTEKASRRTEMRTLLGTAYGPNFPTPLLTDCLPQLGPPLSTRTARPSKAQRREVPEVQVVYSCDAVCRRQSLSSRMQGCSALRQETFTRSVCSHTHTHTHTRHHTCTDTQTQTQSMHIAGLRSLSGRARARVRMYLFHIPNPPWLHCGLFWPQIIDVDAGTLQNVITFPPEGAFVVNSDIQVEGDQRVAFKFNSAELRLPNDKSFKLPPFGQGW